MDAHDKRTLGEIKKILSDVEFPVFRKVKYNFPNEKLDENTVGLYMLGGVQGEKA